MSRFYRDLVAHRVGTFADEWAKRYVAAAFEGDVAAALSLSVALSNDKRGIVACAMWQAKVPRPAYRAYLASVWLHDHGHVVQAAQTRARLRHMFRYAQFPIPPELPDVVTVWRGTCYGSQDEAKMGYSWTMDRDVACWFAMRFGGANASSVVLRADIPKADVLLVNDERSEREIVFLGGAHIAEVDGDPVDWLMGFERFASTKAQRR
jgi:hypothetical protein